MHRPTQESKCNAQINISVHLQKLDITETQKRDTLIEHHDRQQREYSDINLFTSKIHVIPQNTKALTKK
jgi:hypothetical protein